VAQKPVIFVFLPLFGKIAEKEREIHSYAFTGRFFLDYRVSCATASYLLEAAVYRLPIVRPSR
jgi:hypothetical protein